MAEGSEPAPSKRVAPVELFFDLVFVLAVTEVSTLLEEDHGWGGVLRALAAFVPVYWLWVRTAIQTNARDTARTDVRLGIFAVALAAVFMALALPRAYEDLGVVFAAAYWAGRGVLGIGVLRDRPAGVIPVNPVTVSLVVTGPLVLAGAIAGGDAQVALWAVAAAIDLSTPTVLRRRMAAMHFDAEHLSERFSLFVLIALGESVVALGASLQAEGSIGAASAVAIAAAFALSCGVWWVYFHLSLDMIGWSLAHARVQLDITRLVLSYGHLLLVAAIIALAVGMHGAVAHPSAHLHAAYAALLCGGVALYLATFGMTRWVMRRMVSTVRLSAAAVALVLIPVTAVLPALAGLLVLAALLVAVNLVEHRRVQRTPSEQRPWVEA